MRKVKHSNKSAETHLVILSEVKESERSANREGTRCPTDICHLEATCHPEVTCHPEAQPKDP